LLPDDKTSLEKALRTTVALEKFALMAMNEASDTGLVRSCTWIRKNWDATNLEVPADLRSLWSRRDEKGPSELQLAVLLFGLIQQNWRKAKTSRDGSFQISASALLEFYNIWQIKLALADLHHVSDIETSPVPLFVFSATDQIHFSRK